MKRFACGIFGPEPASECLKAIRVTSIVWHGRTINLRFQARKTGRYESGTCGLVGVREFFLVIRMVSDVWHSIRVNT